MSIDYKQIYDKAVKRQKALEELVEQLTVAHEIVQRFEAIHHDIKKLHVLWETLDDEAKMMLPEPLRVQLNRVDYIISTTTGQLQGRISAKKLSDCVKEFQS